ncbi:MAG: hypothetical protein ACLGII_08225 [Gammaproteobacteria bacterium]|jgi:hypothetical protein
MGEERTDLPPRLPAEGGAGAHRRVRLAIDALTPQTRRAIDTAVRLALEAGDSIDCVFVEELELFRAAELPFTRELGVFSRAPRRFDTIDLIHALRRQAAEARQALAQAAARSRLHWSFEVVRGALLREALQRAGEDDLIVIGVAGFDVDGAIERAIEREALAALAAEPGWALRRRSTTLVAYPRRPQG